MTADEIRDRWSPEAAYAHEVLVQGEIAAQLAEVNTFLRTFGALYCASKVADAKDVELMRECLQMALSSMAEFECE